MKRILGLGQTAQRVLLAIYAAGFGNDRGSVVVGVGVPVGVLDERRLVGPIGWGRYLAAVDRLKARGLLRQADSSLTPSGRSAVVRVAPLYLAALLCALVGMGCVADLAGPPFTEESAPDDPDILVLVTGKAEYSADDLCVPQPKARRRSEADAGALR